MPILDSPELVRLAELVLRSAKFPLSKVHKGSLLRLFQRLVSLAGQQAASFIWLWSAARDTTAEKTLNLAEKLHWRLQRAAFDPCVPRVASWSMSLAIGAPVRSKSFHLGTDSRSKIFRLRDIEWLKCYLSVFSKSASYLNRHWTHMIRRPWLGARFITPAVSVVHSWTFVDCLKEKDSKSRRSSSSIKDSPQVAYSDQPDTLQFRSRAASFSLIGLTASESKSIEYEQEERGHPWRTNRVCRPDRRPSSGFCIQLKRILG
jgi:hypothetical protein